MVSTGPVIVVQHEEGAPAAWLGERLGELGVPLDVRRPYAGDALPDRVDEHAGLLVLGGSVDSWDDATAPWLPATRELVRDAERSGVPTLGICLGHQLAALALGGEVVRNPAGPTVAVLPVCWGQEAPADPLCAGLRAVGWAVHWNNDIVTRLPDGARVLARSPDGAVQAARLGRHVWGVQFHPEAGPAVLARWVAEDGAVFTAAGFDLDAYLAAAQHHEAELDAGCRRLAAAFAALLGREGR